MNLENLFDKLSSNPLLIVAAIIISLLPLLKFLKESFIDLELSRFKRIINTKDYENSLSEDLKSNLLDARDRAVFKRIYGLNINKKYRDIILKITSQPNINIDCEDIRRSSDYIDFDSNYMVVEYKPWIHTFKTINYYLGLFYFISGSLILIMVLASNLDISLISGITRILLVLDDSFYICVGAAYIFISYDQIKNGVHRKSVIRILAQADQLPQYIKIDENWRGKAFLNKINFRTKSFIERDFDTWE